MPARAFGSGTAGNLDVPAAVRLRSPSRFAPGDEDASAIAAVRVRSREASKPPGQRDGAPGGRLRCRFAGCHHDVAAISGASAPYRNGDATPRPCASCSGAQDESTRIPPRRGSRAQRDRA